MYAYYAGQFLYSALVLDETSSRKAYFESLSLFVVNAIVFVALVAGSTLVAFGLKSRVVALLLALANLGFVFYHHPFYKFAWREDGEWKYDEDMPMPNVALQKGVTPMDLDLEQMYDLHRYYFFLGISTSGALLLLAQFGPGDIAVQADERILPMRAQD